MQFSRRSLSFTGLSVAMLALVIAACTEDNPVGPGPEPPVVKPPVEVTGLAAIECRASLKLQTMSCGTPTPGAGQASADVMVHMGDTTEHVRMTSSGLLVTPADSSFRFNAFITNKLRQPLDGRRQKIGTSDGTNPDTMRVYFLQQPIDPANDGDGPGTWTVANPDGHEAFTENGQPYYNYSAVLDSGQTSGGEQWVFKYTPNADSLFFLVIVQAKVTLPHGYIDITPQASTIDITETTTLSAVVRNFAGNPVPGAPVVWSSSDTMVATVSPSGVVTGKAKGTVTITAFSPDSTNPARKTGTATVTVNSAVVAAKDSVDAIINHTLRMPAPGVLVNDTDANTGDAPSVVPEVRTGVKGGTAVFAANGSFTYLKAQGSTAQVDSVTYHVTDGVEVSEGLLVVNLPTRVWYVAKDSSAGPSQGTDQNPFHSLAEAQTASITNETLYVLAGATGYAEGITLKDGQSLTGQGAAAIEATLNGVTQTLLAAGSTPFLAGPASGATVQLNAVGGSNTVQSLSIGSTSGAAILGSGFGTLNLGGVTIAANGAALDLTNGTLTDYTFASLSSSASAGHGVRLVGVSGGFTASAGAINNPATAAFLVSGGSARVTYAGSITLPSGSSAAVLDVAGNHNESATPGSGVLSFTGAVTADGGSGLQFNDADGTYSFTGTAALNGPNARVSLTNGTDGTFTFGPNVSVGGTTSPTGTAFAVSGSAPTVTFSGSLTKSNAGLLVDVSSQTAGNVTFQTGTLTATAGDGIQLNDADGGVSFTGAVALSGGAGVDVIAGSGGAIVFQPAGGSRQVITNASGIALNVSNGNNPANVLFTDSIASSGTGRPVVVEGVTGGSVTVAAKLVSTGAGILVQNNATGTPSISFTGSVKQLNTGANQAVTLTNNGTASVSFTGGGLDIDTNAATGFSAATGGTLTVSGSGNTVNAIGATAVSLTAGVTLGAGHVTWQNVTSTGTSTGIVLANVNNVAGVGGAFRVNGGTITPTIVPAVSLTTLTAPTELSGVTLGGQQAITGTNFDSLRVSLVSASSNGGPVLQLTTGTVTELTADPGFSSVVNNAPAGSAVSLTGVHGSFTVNGGGLTGGAGGPAFLVSGGTVSVTWKGGIGQGFGGALVSVANHDVGTITFNTGVLSATAGAGVQLNNADGAYKFNGTLTLSGGAVVLVNGGSDGEIDFEPFTGSQSVTNAAGVALTVSNGGVATNVDFKGNITTTGTGRPVLVESVGSGTVLVSGTISSNVPTALGILVQNNTAGTITFSGSSKTLNTGATQAVTLTNNGSAAIEFTGGGLNLTTSSGTAFNASGGGTVTVQGANNIVNATAGVGVRVDNTSIGANGLTFRSVSATGGANGIFLNNTGSASGLNVTGDGSGAQNGSGGTIHSTAAAADGATGGIGVYALNTRPIILKSMNLHDFANFAVYLKTTANVTLEGLLVNGNNGSNEGADETAIRVDNVNGTVFLQGSNVSGGYEDNVLVNNDHTVTGGSAQVLDSLVIRNTTIGPTRTGTFGGSIAGNDAVRITARDGTTKVRVRNTTFTAWRGDGLDMKGAGSAVMDLQFTNNVLTNSYKASGDAVSGSTNLSLGGGGSGSNVTYTYQVLNNSLRDALGAAIAVDKGSGTGSYGGKIYGNTIGQNGVAGSGSSQGSGISIISVGGGTNTVQIDSNFVHGYSGIQGILLQNGDAASGGSGTLNATATRNTLTNPGAFTTFGFYVNIGTAAGDAHQACVKIENNSIGSASSSSRVRFREAPTSSSTIRVPGYVGGQFDTAALSAYVSGKNGGASVGATGNATGGFLNTAGGAACPLP